MKKNFQLIFVILLIACNNSNTANRQDETLNQKSISEDIEWSNMWMVSVNKKDLPKVLIIGDSHVERYYPVVAGKLLDKAYCSKFTTSRSLGDPALIEQLKAVFFSFKFDVISFNNGLHGVEYSDAQYSLDIPEVYKLFTGSNPGVKLVWVNTTARRLRDSIAAFDGHNQGVINRNRAIENFTKAHNIPVVDLFSLSIIHPDYYESDGIHFNKQGVEDEARYVSDEILRSLKIKKLFRGSKIFNSNRIRELDTVQPISLVGVHFRNFFSSPIIFQ
jgi:hypothetical protein